MYFLWTRDVATSFLRKPHGELNPLSDNMRIKQTLLLDQSLTYQISEMYGLLRPHVCVGRASMYFSYYYSCYQHHYYYCPCYSSGRLLLTRK